MSENASERTRRLRPVVAASLVGAILLVAAYVASVVAYRSSIQGDFTPPQTRPDTVAVVFVPLDIDTIAKEITAEVLIFPGQQLLTIDGRLARDISIDTYTAKPGTITYQQGSVPTPVRATIPAMGVVQEYPFDNYTIDLQARSVLEPEKGETEPTALPLSLSVYFEVPGWTYTSISEDPGFTSETVTSYGRIDRAGGTVTIALIFIILMVMFGVLAVITVVAGWRGRLELTISTAAWLTSSVFALIALRNALPGHPPLGSWMDVLAYFWVIATIMVMIGVTVVSLVVSKPEES
ncbi:MAG TPA: DUF4436 family protein [Candidatus Nanopelagicales bacterium]|nr:DUF4436 family protein [Candidatus Nanopelagicales bacterium]